MISHGLLDSASSWVILWTHVQVNYNHSSSLSETWHKLLVSLDMSIDHTIGGFIAN